MHALLLLQLTQPQNLQLLVLFSKSDIKFSAHYVQLFLEREKLTLLDSHNGTKTLAGDLAHPVMPRMFISTS